MGTDSAVGRDNPIIKLDEQPSGTKWVESASFGALRLASEDGAASVIWPTGSFALREDEIEKLNDLKYEFRNDIRDRAALEKNFREKFQTLNRVTRTDAEFRRLLDEIVTPDVFAAAHTLRNRNSFTRDDGTPLNYTLVNIADWCKNTFEVVSQLRINTDYSHHRYDVLLLVNGVPVAQIELKTLGINPRRAIGQIVEYKNDPGNGYTRTILCFIQLFIVSNRDSTYYFANNNPRHFSFEADERFLPIYEYAAPDNSKIKGIDRFADAFLTKCALGQTIREPDVRKQRDWGHGMRGQSCAVRSCLTHGARPDPRTTIRRESPRITSSRSRARRTDRRRSRCPRKSLTFCFSRGPLHRGAAQ